MATSDAKKASNQDKNQSCSVCLSTKCWRSYAYGGTKWEKVGVNEKLINLGINDLGCLQSSNAVICQTCLNHLESASKFMVSVKKNLPRLFQHKRQADKLEKDQQETAKTNGSKRIKLLKTGSEVPKQNTATIPPNNTDHGYSKQVESVNKTISTPTIIHSYAIQDSVKEEKPKIEDFGLHGKTFYSQSGTFTKEEQENLIKLIKTNNLAKTMSYAMTIVGFSKAVRAHLLTELHEAASKMCTLKHKSVLRTLAPVESLTQGRLVQDVIDEITTEMPFLMDILATLASSSAKGSLKKINLKGTFALIYSTLMVIRNQHLSAFARTMSFLFTRHCLNEEGLEICHKMRICQSTNQKIVLLDECCSDLKRRCKETLGRCFLCHFIGDNCDVRITPNNLSSDHQVKDCHYYATLLVFSRMAEQLQNMDDTIPQVIKERIPVTTFLLQNEERRKMYDVYKVILGRLMCIHFTCFKWVKDILPDHIPHAFQEVSSRQSVSIALDLDLLNEAKYEDCVKILTRAATFIRFLCRFIPGLLARLAKTSIPYLGDQMTRVRLQGGKLLLKMAPTREGRLDDIGPFLCTLWHMKQDLLEKAYKLLWSKLVLKDKCTLKFFQRKFDLTNVNGNTKSNFKAHEQLFLLLGEFMLMEQIIAFLRMNGYDDWPSCIPRDINDRDTEYKKLLFNKIMDKFFSVQKYFDFSTEAELPIEEHQQLFQTPDGNFIIFENPDDEVFNYASCLCVYALQLMQMNDMAKEGDLERSVLSAKVNIPLFYSHSTLSKYFVESVDYVLKTNVISSPQMRLHLLDASFYNKDGGLGNNVEANLHMEHNIGQRKDIIRSLGANKTEKAIVRATTAAETVCTIVDNFAQSLEIKSKSGKHTHYISDEDRQKVKDNLRELDPFNKVPGRKYESISIKVSNPLKRIDKTKFRKSVQSVKVRLCRGQVIETNEDNQHI